MTLEPNPKSVGLLVMLYFRQLTGTLHGSFQHQHKGGRADLYVYHKQSFSTFKFTVKNKTNPYILHILQVQLCNLQRSSKHSLNTISQTKCQSSSHIGQRGKSFSLIQNMQTSAVCTLTDFVDSFPESLQVLRAAQNHISFRPQGHFLQNSREAAEGTDLTDIINQNLLQYGRDCT